MLNISRKVAFDMLYHELKHANIYLYILNLDKLVLVFVFLFKNLITIQSLL